MISRGMKIPRDKKGGNMRKNNKRITVCIIAMTVFIQLSACQKNPTTELIPNKSSNEFSRTVFDAPKEPYTYEAPSHWNEFFDIKNVEVEINSDIYLPDKNTYPVFLLSKRIISSDEVKKIVEVMGGEVIKARAGGSDREETIEEIEIVSRGQYCGVDEKTGEPIYEEYEGQDEQLEKLKAMLNAIGDNSPWSMIDSTSFSLPMDKAFLTADGNNIFVSGTSNNIRVSTYSKGYVQLEKWVLEGDAFPGESPHELKNIFISSTEAQNAGTEFLRNIGISNYVVAATEKARILLRSSAVLSEGWQITLIRDDGLRNPVDILNYSAGGLLMYPEEEYAASWPAEQITVFADETGVRQFSWSNATEIRGIANKNVQLKPFSDIQSTIRNALKFSLSWFNEEKTYANSKLEVMVTRVALTRCIQRLPGDDITACFAPAWVVFVTTRQSLEDGTEPTILVISAIDNTYINIRG